MRVVVLVVRVDHPVVAVGSSWVMEITNHYSPGILIFFFFSFRCRAYEIWDGKIKAL